jgi:hypothetical protein
MPLQVGAEVEAYCSPCADMRWHVIVALVGDRPVKVECRSCRKQHSYRTGPPGSGATTSRSTKPKSKTAPREPEVDLSRIDARIAKPYAPSTTFVTGDVVRHTNFGLGLVTALSGPQRVTVHFPSGPRTLVHDRATR